MPGSPPPAPDGRFRRRLLASLPAAGLTVLAGCAGGSGSGSGPGSAPDCVTNAGRRGDADLIQSAAATPDGDGVVLHLTPTETAVEGGTVAFVDVDGERGIPVVGGRRTYRLHVGQRPLHDRPRLTAMSAPATPEEFPVVGVNCFAEGSAGAGR